MTTAAKQRYSAVRFFNAFKANHVLSKTSVTVVITVQLAIFLLVWVRSPFKILPQPVEVWTALGALWQQGLGQELIVSLKLNAEALAWSSLISIGLAYFSVIPFFRILIRALSKGRFLSLTGFSVVFFIVLGGGHVLKTWLLTIGITVFFLTSMVSVVDGIPKESFDHARTLRMSEWRVVWEVVVLGTLDKAIEMLRQNAAIGWMMLTMVEGISRSEGGIGGMLINQNKYMRLPEVFAIQLVILIVGLCQDYLIGVFRNLVCPYADLTMEKR